MTPAKHMKSTLFGAIAVALALLLAWTWAGAQPPADRPSGVSEEDWISLSDSAGIVITVEDRVRVVIIEPPGEETVEVPGRLTGVLMTRRDGSWVRVDLQPPGMGYIPIQ